MPKRVVRKREGWENDDAIERKRPKILTISTVDTTAAAAAA